MGITKRTRKKTGARKTVYDAELYIRGVRIGFRTFETRSQAEVWLEKARSEHLDPSKRGAKKKLLSLGDVFRMYQQQRVSQLRRSTQQTLVARMKYISDSPLVRVRMADLDDRDIDRWFEWLKSHTTTLNSGRKNFRHEFNLLRSVLNWYRDFYNSSFVSPLVKRHRDAINYKPVPPRRPDYYIRPEDIVNWISWLKQNKQNPAIWRLALFLTHTGARVGEACGLAWQYVDLGNSIASVMQTVWWDHRTKVPNIQAFAKTDGSIRILRLSNPVKKMLEDIPRSFEKKIVFTNPDGSLLKYRVIQASFNHGFESLGLPWRSTHICRHSFGTLALKATRDLSGVQAALGHSDIRDTQRYAKIVALADGVANEKTAELIGGKF